MTERPTIITWEHILAPFGFVLRWSVQSHWADVTAWKVEAREADGDPLRIEFHRDGATHYPDSTSTPDKAEAYLQGFVKWDGCMELDMGQPHWCGAGCVHGHIELLRHVYVRALELMESANLEVAGELPHFAVSHQALDVESYQPPGEPA